MRRIAFVSVTIVVSTLAALLIWLASDTPPHLIDQCVSDGKPLQTAPIAIVAVINFDTLVQRHVLKQRRTYDGKVVVVSGCFRTGLETATLQPCGVSVSPDDALWVEDVRMLDDMERIIPGLRRDRRTGTEPLGPAEAEAYRRLMSGDWPKPTPVTLRGEFQSSDTPRFGHLNAFKHRLVLYKVVELR
jgi:hypothetical protein